MSFAFRLARTEVRRYTKGSCPSLKYQFTVAGTDVRPVSFTVIGMSISLEVGTSRVMVELGWEDWRYSNRGARYCSVVALCGESWGMTSCLYVDGKVA